MFLSMFSVMQVADVFANLAIHTCSLDWGYTWIWIPGSKLGRFRRRLLVSGVEDVRVHVFVTMVQDAPSVFVSRDGQLGLVLV